MLLPYIYRNIHSKKKDRNSFVRYIATLALILFLTHVTLKILLPEIKIKDTTTYKSKGICKRQGFIESE